MFFIKKTIKKTDFKHTLELNFDPPWIHLQKPQSDFMALGARQGTFGMQNSPAVWRHHSQWEAMRRTQEREVSYIPSRGIEDEAPATVWLAEPAGEKLAARKKKWMDCRFEKVGRKLGVEAVQSVDSFSLIPLDID